ncbi:DUF1127 domain-containing protein [Aliiruegeria lutimaris]|uniref:YjiS-like domain-containing protein n=1 Tax=Aliiruegeria lutimaris TaxID=571298 RepID=A0A1G9I942_9RHOB|nr:DUF1127 domain-containing protein [Aliiruegeria lutimaris]SDL21770.1 protein of unknown function [Aliiruegeria lutimaris]
MQQILDTRITAHHPARASFAARLFRRVLDADHRYRERLALEKLSDEQLHDIGKSRAELARMMRKGNRA